MRSFAIAGPVRSGIDIDIDIDAYIPQSKDAGEEEGGRKEQLLSNEDEAQPY